MNKTPVIFSCSPDAADAASLIAALFSENLDVLCVVAGAGRCDADTAVTNALQTVTYAGKNVPVYKGPTRPLRVDRKIPKGNPLDLPAANLQPKAGNYADAITNAVKDSAEKVTILSSGPLTGIATWIAANPGLLRRIERICLLGGATLFDGYAYTESATAEFNVWFDPDAAAIVFQSGIPIAMLTLEGQKKLVLSNKELEKTARKGSKLGVYLKNSYDNASDEQKERACAGAGLSILLSDSQIFTTKAYYVTVDLVGEHSYGCTVTDFRGRSGKEKNVDLVMDVDKAKFAALL